MERILTSAEFNSFKCFEANPDLIFNDDIFSIAVDPEIECGILTWNQFVFSEEYRQISDCLLSCIQSFGWKKMIRNDHKFHTISDEDVQWMKDDYVPRAYAAGLRYCAIVAPRNLLSNLIVTDTVEQISLKNVQIRSFENMEDAKRWISEL